MEQGDAVEATCSDGGEEERGRKDTTAIVEDVAMQEEEGEREERGESTTADKDGATQVEEGKKEVTVTGESAVVGEDRAIRAEEGEREWSTSKHDESKETSSEQVVANTEEATALDRSVAENSPKQQVNEERGTTQKMETD